MCICYKYLQYSVEYRRGRLKITYLLGELLLVIHTGVAGSMALRRLRKKNGIQEDLIIFTARH